MLPTTVQIPAAQDSQPILGETKKRSSLFYSYQYSSRGSEPKSNSALFHDDWFTSHISRHAH